MCVDDCSPDNTYEVLTKYHERYPDKITVLKNPVNMSAGISRNNGYFLTKDTIPSEFIWIVDGDDRLANSNVLGDIHQFHMKNPKAELICVGCTLRGSYRMSDYRFPHGLWSTVIRSDRYVPAIDKNIQTGNDVFPHFIMFDNVDDDKIAKFNHNCYIWKEGNHKAPTKLNWSQEVANEINRHIFRKKYIENYLYKTYKWLKRPSSSSQKVVPRPHPRHP